MKNYSKYRENRWLNDIMDFDKKFYLRKAGKDRDDCMGHRNIFRCNKCNKVWQPIQFNLKDYAGFKVRAEFIKGFNGTPCTSKDPPEIFCRKNCGHLV